MKEALLTKSAYMWTRILGAPFWAIYNMLPFILYKDLGATPFQCALIITLKPLVSIFSIYWSAAIARKPELLVKNIIWAGIIGHLPFLFCPFVDSPWFFIASFALYMMLARGVVPAWMEILKLNLPKVTREKVFAKASLCGYLGTGLLGLFLDSSHEAWRWVFTFSAALSFIAVLFQLRIPIQALPIKREVSFPKLTQPWCRAFKILQNRRDFRLFQVGFMLGGMGLVLMHPALPVFFEDVLGLTYTELALAYTVCKGVGFALGTPLWTRMINRVDIYKICAFVTAFACLFPLLLYNAQIHLVWLYVAYMIYGVMQAGSELCWNLSGPIFARHEESIDYSNVNILAVGVRGAIVPALGCLLCWYAGPSVTLAVGGLLSLLATERMMSYSRQSVLSET